MPLFNWTIDARFDFDSNGRLHATVSDPLAPGIRILDALPKLIWYRVRKAEQIFARIDLNQTDVSYFQEVANAFRLDVQCDQDPQPRVPTSGPLVVVANHPLNGIDGMAIASVISQIRSDVKVMLTSTFAGIPGLKEHAIFVNASSGPSAQNRSIPVREAIAWLKDGNALVLFPAGQGSYVRSPDAKWPVDAQWSSGTATFLKNTGADVLPIFVEGCGSYTFLQTRNFWAPLSTLFLLREILIQEGVSIKLRMGQVTPSPEILAKGSKSDQVNYLRQLTYALAE